MEQITNTDNTPKEISLYLLRFINLVQVDLYRLCYEGFIKTSTH